MEKRRCVIGAGFKLPEVGNGQQLTVQVRGGVSSMQARDARIEGAIVSLQLQDPHFVWAGSPAMLRGDSSFITDTAFYAAGASR
jgi:hypothetical protein